MLKMLMSYGGNSFYTLLIQSILMKLMLLAVAMVLLVSVSSATVINATSKEIVIAGETPNIYGIIKTNTSDYYVTGYPTSVAQTLEIMNAIDLNTPTTVTEVGGILT